jgi:hypothetical protein
MIDHQGRETGIRKLVEPLGELGPEVVDRLDEGGGEL